MVVRIHSLALGRETRHGRVAQSVEAADLSPAQVGVRIPWRLLILTSNLNHGVVREQVEPDRL